MKKYEDILVEKLQLFSEKIESNGIEILLKKSPLEDRDGYLDPIEKGFIDNSWVGSMGGELPPLEIIVPIIRNAMGFPNLNLNTQEMITKYEDLNFEGNQVELWRYFKRRSDKKIRPCLIFYHGGGWIGGTPYVTENPCKLIAELADAVVFNIGYSLAPEKQFPNGFNDCFNALKHIYENADYYEIDKNKITIAGDSAGGNYTAAVALRAKDEKLPMVYQQILIYPAVTMADAMAPGYEWDESFFEIADEEVVDIKPGLNLGKPEKYGTDPMVVAYLKNPEDISNPYVSPMLAKNHSGLPKTLIAVAEFDGLRLQGEFYASQLKKAGVETKVLRYKGLTHAFLDRLGYLPQSEDLCIEIAKAISE